ncbi:LysR family transcriptional regulator [Paraburkholderia ginsengisoli]|uniref:LysR family transcriptional regulator n=1 Tax=Paraburkholderia ginsengisoli TaxID=311231 RepID=A0A7T4N8Q6_9BURK|nr:LysR family transcriptional regulator [Paraburkholderia ginsengisoli]QQC67329.1 LysR family transcriptional regulator [Paraburkholderia ginsengisoli]
MKALDMEAVQAFVMVADLSSFTRAAEALGTTQSAVSLKIRRLEEGLGRRLLERTPRLVRLSADGHTFLTSARSLVAAHQHALGSFDAEQRRLVVGISHHIVGAELPRLLKQMSAAEPHCVMEMRVSTSRAILEEFDSGALDAAIVLRHDKRRRGGDVILEESFGWIASPGFEHRTGTPLRLATQAEPCSVRSMAITALNQAGIAWTEVFVGGGITTIGAAVLAGLAVAALGRRVAPPGTIDIGSALGLPPLPSRTVMLYSNLTDQQARRSLRTLSAAIRSTAG